MTVKQFLDGDGPYYVIIAAVMYFAAHIVAALVK
jgi:hypothetical protein